MPKFLRRWEVLPEKKCSRSTLYAQINAGLMTRGIRFGSRYVVWPAEECEAISAARVRGASDDEIRALVDQLHAARKVA